jgi:hypothetical protein
MLARDASRGSRAAGSPAARAALVVVASLFSATAISSGGGCGSEPRGAFEPTDAGAEGEGALGAGVDAPPPTACERAASRRSPLGCEYVAFAAESGPFKVCTVLLVSNPGSAPAQLTMRYGEKFVPLGASVRLLTGSGRDPGWAALPGDLLMPGASAVVALVKGERAWWGPGDCPFPALIEDSSAFVREEGTTSAFRLTTDEPVFATYFNAYGLGGGEASTALRAAPSLGSEYMDVGMYRPGRTNQQNDVIGGHLTPYAAFATVVANAPTRVSLGGEGGAASLLLQAGEVHQFRRDDLFIGSPITADHPIAVFVGSPEAFIPYDVSSAEQIMSQIAPPGAWSSEYAAVGYPSRRAGRDDPALYRIVAARDGTTLDYDPAPPAGAPSSLDAGGLAVFRTSSPFVVRSQDVEHPLYVSVAMTGGAELCLSEPLDGGEPGELHYYDCRGDPELVSLPSPAEYAMRFAFSAYHLFADSHLVLVRKKSGGRFGDVLLDCAGVVTGWSAIGTRGDYETVSIALSQGNFEPQTYGGGTCTLGAHTMTSAGPFTATLWGWTHDGVDGLVEYDDGGWRSYGYALYGLDPEPPPAR